jgi:hypothetical protein
MVVAFIVKSKLGQQSRTKRPTAASRAVPEPVTRRAPSTENQRLTGRSGGLLEREQRATDRGQTTDRSMLTLAGGGSRCQSRTRLRSETSIHVPEDGKAEIVNGELQLLSLGDLPSRAGREIYISLHARVRRTGQRRAYPDNAAVIVDLPNRRSFTPDVAYDIGPRTRGKFLEGADVLAIGGP